MVSDDINPLQRVLRDRMAVLDWRPSDLHRALADRGTALTLSAVCLWLDGGGIADRHRALVAEVLGLPLDAIARAASARALGAA